MLLSFIWLTHLVHLETSIFIMNKRMAEIFIFRRAIDYTENGHHDEERNYSPSSSESEEELAMELEDGATHRRHKAKSRSRKPQV